MTWVIQFNRLGSTFRVHTLNSGQAQSRPFRAIPSNSDQSDQFRPKKCENRPRAAFHPDLTGAIRSYPDLKNVKTRLHGPQTAHFPVPLSRPFACLTDSFLSANRTQP